MLTVSLLKRSLETGMLNEWISCRKSMPPREHDVLVKTIEGIMYVASLCNWEDCHDFHYQTLSQDPSELEDVTNWMELPK